MFKFFTTLVCLIAVAFSMRLAVPVPRDPQSLECEACVSLLGAVESWVEENSTVTYVEQRLDSVCQLIPGFASACDQLVAYGLQEAIDFFKAGGSATDLCTKFGACSSSFNSYGDGCENCQVVIGAIEKWVQSAPAEKEILNWLNFICNFVPSFNTTCDKIAEVGLGEVLSYISLHENATVVCTQLGLCTSKYRTLPLNPPKPKPIKGPVECESCKWVIGIIEHWLDSGKTQSAIITDLDHLCQKLPDINATCQAIVKVGVPTVIEWIEKEEGPDTVCTQLTVCSSQLSTPKKTVPIESLNNENCDGCKFVINAIEHWLETNTSQQAIITDLEKLCDLIPGIENTCDAIVEAGIPTVIDWIEENENATVVCTQLGLCTSSEKKKAPKPELLKASPLECESCKYTFSAIESWIANNATQQEIIDNLETLCDLIPSLENTCDAIVETGIHTVIRWVQANEDPTTICTQLGICTSSEKKQITRGNQGLKFKRATAYSTILY